jgi:hypothetical protein
MRQIVESPRLEALGRLLARPDPSDLPKRANVVRWQGDPNRRSTRLPPIMMAWLQRRFLEIDGEGTLPSATPAWARRVTARTPKLHMVRRTGADRQLVTSVRNP